MLRNPDIVMIKDKPYGSCDPSLYDSIFVYMDGRYYEIPPDAFLNVDKHFALINKCRIDLGTMNSHALVIGVTFLRSYYSIWDDDNTRIAFVPNLETTAQILTEAAPTAVLSVSKGLDFDYTAFMATVVSTQVLYLGLLAALYLIYL